jgi:hypothetical protein
MAEGEGAEALAIRADALLEGVTELRRQLNLSTTLEQRQTDTEMLVERQGRRLLSTVLIVIVDIILTVGITWLSFVQHNADQSLCHATQRSWDYRSAAIEIQTAHTNLSPKVEQLFPASQIDWLRLQIAAANATKDAQRRQLVKLNGPRPNC